MAAGKVKPSQPGSSREDYRSQIGAQAQNNWATRQGGRKTKTEKFGHKEQEKGLLSKRIVTKT